ncbi:hypothetical protein RF11_04780 [Thelohanellus kitauei]|uniref:Uncharacterized protein n=1 Tax=Thelohanellus kitauei TaxID=669202 RepID=A0A0C2IAU2_THEKT|nr:hypothetical protein RF11_04780 [Thelohanellus kitauei]
MDRCVIKEYDHFFTMESFLDYLKNEGIPKDNYTKMIISAQCHLERATNDYFGVKATLAHKTSELMDYLINRHTATNGTKQSLIQDLKNSSLYKEWTSNRFLSPILRCYLEGTLINRDMLMPPRQNYPNPFHKSATSATPKTPKQALFVLIISVVGFAFIIVAIKLYQHLIYTRNLKVRFHGEGIYYEIRDNVIVSP